MDISTAVSVSVSLALAGVPFYIQARQERKLNLRRNASLVSLSAVLGKDMGTAWITGVMCQRSIAYKALCVLYRACWVSSFAVAGFYLF